MKTTLILENYLSSDMGFSASFNKQTLLNACYIIIFQRLIPHGSISPILIQHKTSSCKFPSSDLSVFIRPRIASCFTFNSTLIRFGAGIADPKRRTVIINRHGLRKSAV